MRRLATVMPQNFFVCQALLVLLRLGDPCLKDLGSTVRDGGNELEQATCELDPFFPGQGGREVVAAMMHEALKCLGTAQRV